MIETIVSSKRTKINQKRILFCILNTRVHAYTHTRTHTRAHTRAHARTHARTRAQVRARARAQVRTWHWSGIGTGAKSNFVAVQVWHDSCYNSNSISIYIGRDIFPLYHHHHYQKCKTNRTCIYSREILDSGVVGVKMFQIN